MNVNTELVFKILKSDCITCNLREKRFNKNICKDCIFVKFKRMKNFGITKMFSKHHFYYFMYYSELNWEFPLIPDYDFLGNYKSSRKFMWVIHHKDKNHWNDNKNNLILCLNTEHRYYHNLTEHPMNDPKVKAKFAKTTKRIQKEKVLKGTHNFIINHPMKDPEIRFKTTETLKNTIKNGNIKSRKDNNRQIKILEWMNNLGKGSYLINKELANKFKVRDSYGIKCMIQILIKKKKFKNFKFENNNKSSGYRRWFLIKE